MEPSKGDLEVLRLLCGYHDLVIGDDHDSAAFLYRLPAECHAESGAAYMGAMVLLGNIQLEVFERTKTGYRLPDDRPRPPEVLPDE